MGLLCPQWLLLVSTGNSATAASQVFYGSLVDYHIQINTSMCVAEWVKNTHYLILPLTHLKEIWLKTLPPDVFFPRWLIQSPGHAQKKEKGKKTKESVSQPGVAVGSRCLATAAASRGTFTHGSAFNKGLVTDICWTNQKVALLSRKHAIARDICSKTSGTETALNKMKQNLLEHCKLKLCFHLMTAFYQFTLTCFKEYLIYNLYSRIMKWKIVDIF